MRHFANLDTLSVVVQVIVLDDDLFDSHDQAEIDNIGQSFINRVLRLEGSWLETSITGEFRKQYAGIGFTFGADDDVFIAPQPFPSWTLSSDFDWVSPIPMPDDVSMIWEWDEETGEWIGTPRPSQLVIETLGD